MGWWGYCARCDERIRRSARRQGREAQRQGVKRSGGFLRGRPGLAAVLAEPADLVVDELVDLAVEDRHGVTGLHSGPHVLYGLVRVQDVVADLGPPRAAAIAAQRGHLLGLFLPAPLEELGLDRK